MAKKNKKNNVSACELSAQSLDYLGLSKQPFANEILTSESFFSHQTLTKIIDSLTHQAQFSDLLLLVEGNHGSGKTSLFRQFIQSEIANTKILSIQAEATDTLVQIQQKISIHLQDLGDANHLDDNLKSLQMFDQTPLLVMDSTHVLSDTTLQELIRYQQQLKQQEINLKILFFANTGMTETLKNITDIQSDQMYVQNMPELSPKQADSFIMHKLRNAGYSGEPLFDSKDLSQLFKKCNGTPLDIMEKAAPLLEKIITRKSKPASTIWIKALAGILVISALGGGTFIYLSDSPSSPKIDIADIQISPSEKQPIESVFQTPERNEPKPLDVIDLLENDRLPTEPEQIPSENTRPEANDLNNNNIETTVLDSIIEPLANKAEEAKPLDQTPVIVDNNINEPIKEIPPKPLKKTKIATTKEIIKTPQKPNPTLLQLNNLGLQNADWLLQQKNKNWTLQLLGARDPQTLLKFAQRNHLSSDTAWYKTWLNAKPYYVLVHGSYTSRDEARSAINNLPVELRSLKPWVKSMGSVQKALQ